MSRLPSLPTLPGFDPFNMGQTQQQRQPTMGGGGGSGGNAETQPISPGEESTLLGKTMGGVQAIGNVLGTPGSAVTGSIYGGITGDYSGLTEGLLDPSKRKYGSDILDAMGWKADEPWSMDSVLNKVGHGLAGFGIDVATDPLSMIGIAGKTAKGMEAAEAARNAFKGITGTGEATEQLGKSLAEGATGATGAWSPISVANDFKGSDRALINFHAPFWAQWLGAGDAPLASTNLGFSPDTLAAATKAIGYSPISPVTYLRGLFSSQASPEITEFNGAKQITNDLRYVQGVNARAAVELAGLTFQKGYGDLSQEFQKIMDNYKATGQNINFDEFARKVQTNLKIDDPTLSAGGGAAQVMQQMQEMAGQPLTHTDAAEFASKMIEYRKNLRGAQDVAQQAFNSVGGNVGELNDIYAAFTARHSTAAREAEAAAFRKGGATSEVNPEARRADPARNIPGSDETINGIAKTGIPQGMKRVATDPVVQEEIDKQVAAGTMTLLDGQKTLESLGPKAYDTVPWASGEDAAAKAKGVADEKQYLLQRLGPGAVPPGNINDVNDLRRAVVNKEFINPALKTEFSEQLDPATQQFRRYTRDPDTNLIAPDTATGKIPPGVREMTDGDGNVVHHDYWSESDRFNNQTLMGADGKPAEHPVDALNKWISGMDPKVIKNGVYDQNIVKDGFDNIKELAQRTASLQAAHGYLARPGVIDTTGKAGTALSDVWESSNLNKKGLASFVEKNYGDQLDQMMQADQTLKRQDAIDQFAKSVTVADSAAPGLSAYADIANNTKQGALLAMSDRANTVLKTLLYSIWAASHVRDLVSRLANATFQGNAPLMGSDGILGHTIGMVKYLARPLAEGAAEGWERTGELPQFMEEFNGLGGGKALSQVDLDKNPANYRATGVIPQKGFWGTVLPFGKDTTLNPAAIPGMPYYSDAAVAGGKPINVFVKGGLNAQNYGDYVAQYGYYAAQRAKGLTPSQAMFNVKTAFLTGDNLSPFEKNFLSRVMPFERFSVRNIPYQLTMLAQEPGGMTAQAVRGMTESASQDKQGVYTPDFMAEHQALPVSSGPEGQTFYKNTLLPQNELNDIVATGGKLNWARTAENFAAKLNPLIAMGPELYANKQFKTGRALDQLDTVTGSPTVDSLIHYSPLSRLASEGAQVADSTLTNPIRGLINDQAGKQVVNPEGRKTPLETLMNLTGLGHFSTYQTEKFKELDARQAYQDLLKSKGAKTFTGPYIPAYLQAGPNALPPEQLAQMHVEEQRQEGIRRLLAEQAKQRAMGQPTQ